MGSNIDVNSIANTIYHGAVIGRLTMAYSMASKKLLKVKSPDLDRLSVEDAAKLTALVGGSLATQQWLVNQGFLPGRWQNVVLIWTLVEKSNRKKTTI